MPRLAILVCRKYPEAHPLDRTLIKELRARNPDLEVVWAPWDDVSCDWKSFDMVLIKAPWDYQERVAEFWPWWERATSQTRFFNEPQVINWNIHKGYINELAAHGVPVIPTRVLPKGCHLARAPATDLAGILGDGVVAALGHDLVLKPAVSASGMATVRVSSPEQWADPRTAAWMGDLLGQRDMLVQPYVAGIAQQGEWAMFFIDGRFAHAGLKLPRQQSDGAAVPHLPSPAESAAGRVVDLEMHVTEHPEPGMVAAAERILAQAARIAARLPPVGRASLPLSAAPTEGDGTVFPFLYARVDLVKNPRTGPFAAIEAPFLLGELEVFEPLLLLTEAPATVGLLDQAIGRRLRLLAALPN
ncbi:putative O-ureido-D-serine cyclo-ligase [Paratrimastix pyriformis]|uniref:O-ureido-D-serine cyclo-ligase n=1 Tax=Paratrimastix pyriformis TaxID=342808 RepID=A0ABQ8URQ4_9EUKA|nr:putative O-ureido-D-serine cyclo-ligase [Paratrimastix pyriformis]